MLAQPPAESRIYELAGDSVYTLAELAAELSRQSGKTVPYVNLLQADHEAALLGAGLPPRLADSDAGAAQGGLFDDGRALSALIGRATTPLATAMGQALAALPQHG